MLTSSDYSGLFREVLGLNLSDKAKFIAKWIGGEVVAVAAFDDFDGVDIQVHVIASRLTRDFLRACHRFVFDHCGCMRMTASVHEDHERMIGILRRLGFIEEGRKRQSFGSGRDLLIFGLLFDERKF